MTVWRRTVLALSVILGLLLACRLASPTVEAPPPTSTIADFEPGDHDVQLVFAGRDRSYTLHVPSGLDPERPLALVLAFHGGLGTAAYMPALTGFSRKADREGFLVAYPNGSGALEDRLFTWNGGTCCGYSSRENVDDVGFVRAVIDEIAAHFPVDPRRIYATGISNGGILSYRLACEMGDRIAAIGSVAGTQNLPACAPSAAVAVVHIHGTADQHLPFEGGVGSKSLAGVEFASVAESIDFWRNADRCPGEARVEVSGSVTHTTYSPCAAGTAVELYAIEGGGHAWPGGIAAWQGGDPPPMELIATDVLWSFFAAHPKP
jgi:polyhydroxybutyrate depolymerase